MRLTIVAGFFLPVPPLRGGATEKIWHCLAEVFAAEGHAVTLISRRWPGLPDRETVAGVTYLRRPGADHSRSLALNLLRDVCWGVQAARVLPPADAVICNSVTLPAWLPAFRPAAGRVVAVLGRMPKGQLRFYGRVARLYATSTAVAERAAAQRPSLRERIRVIWNPIDWRLHASASAQGSGPLTIGFIGRIHPEKGLELLLQAAGLLARRPDLPAWRLALTGPVEARDGGGGAAWFAALSSRSASALGSRLEVHPPEFDREALARRYGAIDVFCYPSVAEKGETFGVAVAEAMAAGAAPVVSALACFAELVEDGTTGLVFDHRSAHAPDLLAEALARLLADAALRRTLAQAAQERARRFDTATIARDILGDLNSFLRPTPPT